MTRYTEHVNSRRTPQTQKADPRQVANSGGGFSFVADKWTRLQRFLILGTEGGSYYASEKALTIQNYEALKECLAENGLRTVEAIRSVSVAGRAPKNDPAIFALAVASGDPQLATRQAALDALVDVCRIGTHLFQFAEAVGKFRGGGRSLRRAIARWYDKPIDDLAYQLAKYQQRGGWSHRDVLRQWGQLLKLDAQRQTVIRWALGLPFDARTVDRKKGGGRALIYGAVPSELPRVLAGMEVLKNARSPHEVAAAIAEYRLTHEMVGNEWKTSPDVWSALLQSMPVGAMVRELGRMTRLGVIAPFSDGLKTVQNKLTVEAVRKARLHPISILKALSVYRGGKPLKGKGDGWSPVPQVSALLDDAFYWGFGSIEPTGKRTVLALDVSGSMTWETAKLFGTELRAREGASAMAMVTARTEPQHHFLAFSGGVIPIDITARDSLTDVVTKTGRLSASHTDCAAPMLWAISNNIPVDVFVVYTDSETNANSMHPFQALKRYREKTGIAAKLVVVGMCANKFTIADPSDAGMLDVVGFDTDAPSVISQFSSGSLDA
jgi:60 kDa SS-A/Ro ribonucleoprotein